MILATACGGSSSFDGDYKEATKEDLQAFSKELETVENAEELDFSKGLKLDFEMITEATGEGSLEMKMNLKTAVKDNDLQMAGEAKMAMTGGEEEMPEENVSVYFKNGKCYASMGDLKIVDTIEVDDVIDEFYSDAFEQVLELDDLVEQFNYYGDNVKYSMDKNDKTVKIKFEFEGQVNQPVAPSVTMDMDVECVAVLVFDAQTKALIAYKYESTMEGSTTTPTGEYAVNAYVSMSIEPWEGEIEFPSDLDTYVAA